MEITPESQSIRDMYKILSGSVVPRPIGWISTIDADGNANLAPYSYFNVICPQPPHVLFCPGIRGVDGGQKDTLNNVRSTGQFVVNIVTEGLAQAMNLSATELPPDEDEFDFAGVTAAPSLVVRPPRVAESPIHFECEVVQIVGVSDEPGGGSVVIGRVVHIHIADDVLLDDGKIDLERLQPVGRLAGTGYARITDTFDLVRKPSRLGL